MSTLLHGKGLWAYAHGGFEEFEERIRHALWLAPQMGATHILFKVGQGANYYEDRAAAAAQRIRAAGLIPFAWMWLTLGDPANEALVAKRAFEEGYEGFIFDMEPHSDPALSAGGRYEEASQLGSHLERLGVDLQRLYLCSFPNIYTHRGGPPYTNPKGLPFDQMAEFCRGGTMPMMYGTFLQPPDKVINEWGYAHHLRWCREIDDCLPIYPVLGPYHDEHGQDQMTPEEFEPWLETLDPRAPTFISLYAARSTNPALAPLIRDFELAEERVLRTHRSLIRRLPQALRKFVLGRPATEVDTTEVVRPTGVKGDHVVVESPNLGFLRLREQPTTGSKELLQIPHRTYLRSLEGEATKDKVNQPGQWLKVRTPSCHEGYVAGWYLRWPPKKDDRKPVQDENLAFSQSAWIFGMHATSIDEDQAYRDEIRGLFHGTDKRGWVLFTEAIGHKPGDLGPNPERKARFWNWAREAGYGVIIRLNNGYHDAGTLPRSDRYQAFAETCARYVELYLQQPEQPGACKWNIIIGNEQNNPREWPRQGQPAEPITPERYAEAFNLAYRAIKDVVPDANTSVIPGVVDPYNFSGALNLTPLDYFRRMLGGIEKVDALALHTYTHGHDVDFIKHLKRFDNAPLQDHYYDFQAYRLFMQAVPVGWRRLPVYITETNPLFKSQEGDWGWKNQDIGWIQKAFEEINQWNSRPYAQQICALLLYRWAGDEWTMRDKGELLKGFGQALTHDYRWRA